MKGLHTNYIGKDIMLLERYFIDVPTVRDGGTSPENVPFMNALDDPIIAQLKERINAIADMCNERIKPWEPDAGPRAVRLFMMRRPRRVR